ncbi:MAG: AAA family ATPase [Planctomycetota bacterium]
MDEYKRILNLDQLLHKKSFFLFGPRGVGKSTLIRKQLSPDKIVYINLLKSSEYLKYQTNPSQLEEVVQAHPKKWIVIDEIQRIPELLNEVHRLIEEKKTKFLLTGSSSRKLKMEGVNLLAGRAWRSELFPLVQSEIKHFSLDRALRHGTLPAVYKSDDPEEELDAYCEAYLREEITQEHLIRKLPPFVRFLKIAALSSGQIVNYTKIGSDAQISPNTIKQYFQVLYDTLIAFQITPVEMAASRKSIEAPKFYLFDCGVMNTLAQTEHLDRNSDLYGRAFETWFFNELRSFLSYTRIKKQIHFWQDYNQNEVDFVIGNTAIEVKATKRAQSEDLICLNKLGELRTIKNKFLVCQEEGTRKKNDVIIIHWQIFLSKLWTKDIVLG